MKEKERKIAQKLAELYPVLGEMIEPDSQYSPFDFECKLYIIEVKARDTDYPDWLIEKIKFDKNLELSAAMNKDFLYLTEYGGLGYIYNVNKLVENNYDFKWQTKRLPATTEFSRGNWVDKEVGFLSKLSARKVKLNGV
jgi:hypothetical protein